MYVCTVFSTTERTHDIGIFRTFEFLDIMLEAQEFKISDSFWVIEDRSFPFPTPPPPQSFSFHSSCCIDMHGIVAHYDFDKLVVYSSPGHLGVLEIGVTFITCSISHEVI